MMRSKRGLSEAQFHWLFVMIAGGFILLLLITFAIQGIDAAKKKQTVTILRELETALSNTKTIGDINRKLPADKSVTTTITCDETSAAFSEIKVGTASRNTYSLAIFSRGTIRGDYYVAKALSHNVPFKVDTALYLTDPRTLYVILSSRLNEQENTEFISRVTQLLPTHATVINTTDITQVRNTGFDAVIIIGNNQGQLTEEDFTQQFFKQQIYYIDISSDSNLESGEISFYKKERFGLNTVLMSEPTSAVSYYGRAELLGAIMSATENNYLCQKSKLDTRMKLSAEFYAKRAELLSTEYRGETQANTDACQANFDSANSYLLQIRQNGPSSDEVLALQRINQQNIDRSCPEIY